MPSIFTKIINGEIPCHKVAEDANFIAFLDINPLAKGHTLIVSKNEVDYIFDIDTEVYKQYWAFAQKVAKALKTAVPCKKVGIAVIGLEVPHAHIHLIPMNNVSDMNFAMPKLKIEHSELQEIASKIAAEIH